MRIINPRMLSALHEPRPQPARQRALRLAGLSVLALGALNVLLAGWFHGHTYPRTLLGATAVGNASTAHVLSVAEAQPLPSNITLRDGATRRTISARDAGLYRDTGRTSRSIAAGRSWLPLIAVFQRHRLAVPVGLHRAALQASAARLSPAFRVAPIDAVVVKHGARFSARPATDGRALDTVHLADAISAALDQNHTTVSTPMTRIAPRVSLGQASRSAAQLRATVATKLTYMAGAAHQSPDSATIAGWYTPADSSYALDDVQLRAGIASIGRKLGVHAGNLTDAVNQTKQALASHAARGIALTPFAQTKNYRYCIATRGDITASTLSGVKAKLVSTYTDLRGWSLDGQVTYEYAVNDCDFTVWMSTASQMATFDPICDPYWNCESGGNVVINLDRWNDATPAWHAAGGTMEDYRAMLINHETGHMLGFGHDTCPGTGKPAPVMMQQSIYLGGCTFNIWPVAHELDALRTRLGL